MIAINEFRDFIAKRREAEAAKDEEDLERFADDGGSWIDVEEDEESFFQLNQFVTR